MGQLRRGVAVGAVGAVAVLALGGCSSWDERQGHVCGDGQPTDDCPSDGAASVDCGGTADADFPDVVAATLTPADDGFTVDATLCSAYDTPERHADAWRVLTPDGEVLGVRELLHDHAGEQPFTRSLAEPIRVPDGVDAVVVEGRDLANGWGGATVEVAVPR